IWQKANFQLAQNHRWWWQSFLTGGSSAFWIFMYCIWYYFTKLHVRGFISSFLFFSYSFLACAVYGLLTGTIGFLTAYAFVRRIYRYANFPVSPSPDHCPFPVEAG